MLAAYNADGDLVRGSGAVTFKSLLVYDRIRLDVLEFPQILDAGFVGLEFQFDLGHENDAATLQKYLRHERLHVMMKEG